MAGTLKKARSFSFLIHAGYASILVLLLATHNAGLAFAGILVALTGFFLTHHAAKCPKCSGGFFEGGSGLDGLSSLFHLTTAGPLTCRSCGYETKASDYA